MCGFVGIVNYKKDISNYKEILINMNNTLSKRRWSKARTHLKRSTWKKEEPKFASCPHCHEPVLPHRVCKNCGYYDGKEVIAKKEEN